MTSSGSLRARDLTTDDLESAFGVRSRSFGPLNPSMREWWNTIQIESIEDGLLDAAFAGRPAYLLEYF